MASSTTDHHEHHGHGHSHERAGGELSFTERNRAHWDNFAKSYNTEDTQKRFGDLINKVTAFIRANITWLGVDFLDPKSGSGTSADHKGDRQVRVLDYACGPGTVTNALFDYASEFIGFDLSEKMVEQYNIRFSQQKDEQSAKGHALVANLLAPDGPPSTVADSKFFGFDLVAVGLGFHHFENLPETTQRLVDRLKPGGVFMIIDFLPHKKEELPGDVAHTVAHHGFTEDRIRELFSGAGLVDIDILVMKEEVTMLVDKRRTAFMARGRRP